MPTQNIASEIVMALVGDVTEVEQAEPDDFGQGDSQRDAQGRVGH